MQRLSGREIPPEVETLEQRLVERLNEALDQQVAGGFYAIDPDDRGLAVGEVGSGGVHLRLTVEDVARICAQEALAWF